MKDRTRAWLGFMLTAAVLLALVSWLTVVLVRLDADEVRARQLASLHERLRLALWRMDSWLGPQFAREAMRPADDYRAFPLATTAWTKGFARLGPDDVRVKSPLLGAESPLFPLHFEFGPFGLQSPQVPTGNERDVCEANGIAAAPLDRAAARLRAFEARLDRDALRRRLDVLAMRSLEVGCAPLPDAPVPTQQSVQEFGNRQRALVQNARAEDNAFDNQLRLSQQNKATPERADTMTLSAYAATQAGPMVPNPVAIAEERLGALVPVWLESADGDLLLFARRVTLGDAVRIQGVWVDWPQLQRELLAQVADLFPADGTSLVRCESPLPEQQPTMLASVPVRFVAGTVAGVTSGLPLPSMLALTWGVTLLGLLVLAGTLRTAIGFGERRARFASAVTHELRTPLTTFRMYSEMLADGVVQDPAAQREYLTTLQRESDRLARVVENVLAWSRLEEGRFTSRCERHAVGPLVERLAPLLERRLADVGLQLVVQVEATDASVHTDEDAVGQILFNLVDNAAKYARDAADRRVELRVSVDGPQVLFALRDHGPGVPVALQQRVFAPFDRGAVAAGSNDVPGVGLGLALARGLARDLGGELALDAACADGACFVLSLPGAVS